MSKKGSPPFVSEGEAEALAKKHIEAYINECNCKSLQDTKLASQKMLAMAILTFDTVHQGTAKPVH